MLFLLWLLFFVADVVAAGEEDDCCSDCEFVFFFFLFLFFFVWLLSLLLPSVGRRMDGGDSSFGWSCMPAGLGKDEDATIADAKGDSALMSTSLVCLQLL